MMASVEEEGNSSSEGSNTCSSTANSNQMPPTGEKEVRKPCSCQKSKCLKTYCECFSNGVYCKKPCHCWNCLNKPTYEDYVLKTRMEIKSRNPHAFTRKLDGPRGCVCKKSRCQKHYCGCYKFGIGCTIRCKCEECNNAYGRKNVSAPPAQIESESKEGDSEN